MTSFKRLIPFSTSASSSRLGASPGPALRSIAAAAALVCITMLITLAGCAPEIDPMLKTLDANVISAKKSDISRTMNFILADRQFDQKEFEEKVSLGLNRWANYSSENLEEAKAEESDAAKALLEKYKDAQVLQQNEENTFINTDAYFLQESFWVKVISERASKGQFLNLVEYYRLAADNFKPEEDDESPVTSLVKKLHPGLSAEQSTELAQALLLFDWSVRNIYLMPELDPTDEEIQSQRLNDNEDPIAAGVRITGSQRYPWQALVFGRGDYVDRAKLFLLMARESGLNAAMLTTGEEEKPWAVGVVIGDEYYLFDPKLGMPIPASEPGQIATLKQVTANPELLTSLDLSLEESLADDTKYWVTGDDLETLKALVYIVPESLSKRMSGLEDSLVGDYRLPLAASPEKQLEKLPAVDGVEKGLWDIAFKTHVFREAVRKALPQAVNDDQLNDRLRWYFRDEAYVDNFHPYRTARVRFFKGDFEAEEENLKRNAVESFQFLTYTEDQIDKIGTDRIMMNIAGLSDIKDPALFETRLRSTQQQMRLIRRDMGYFLSQCLFDNGGPGTSANWLETIVNENDAQRWKSGIKYLLGRSYESRKEYDRAIEEYESEDSEQLHGNLIRIRMIKAALKKAYPGAKIAADRDESAEDKEEDAKEDDVEPEEDAEKKTEAEVESETESDSDAKGEGDDTKTDDSMPEDDPKAPEDEPEGTAGEDTTTEEPSAEDAPAEEQPAVDTPTEDTPTEEPETEESETE